MRRHQKALTIFRVQTLVFLESCYEVFAPHASTNPAEQEAQNRDKYEPKTLLRDHYRCHPAIIGFCNKWVYDNNLFARGNHPSKSDFPIAARWYFSDYREHAWSVSEPSHAKKKDEVQEPDEQEAAKKPEPLSVTSGVVNEKQLTVFRLEEMPYLITSLKEGIKQDPNYSVCILSPFVGQYERLRKIIENEILQDPELKELLGENPVSQTALDDYEPTATDTQNTSHLTKKEAEQLAALDAALSVGKKKQKAEDEAGNNDQVMALTIHKSQGQEFDLVYLMPVEDGQWEWPWSQGQRLINVAVSRAKKELRLLTSCKLMEEELQHELFNKTVPSLELPEADVKNELFIQKLCRYTFDSTKEFEQRGELGRMGEDFGLIRSKVCSIFDYIPWEQDPHSTNKDSAPEILVGKAAYQVAQKFGLTVLHSVPFEAVVLRDGKTLFEHLSEAGGLSLESEQILEGDQNRLSGWHFDYVLLDSNNRIILALEADGKPHRYESTTTKDLDSAAEVEYFKLFGVSDEVSSASSKVAKTKRVLDDFKKNLAIENLCSGVVAHLGADSTFGDNRAYFETCRKKYIADNPELTQLIGENEGLVASEVTRPEDIAEGTSFVLLRLPSDGSTMYELDDMPAIAPAQKPAFATTPTIDDYVKYCCDTLRLSQNSAASVNPQIVEGKLDIHGKKWSSEPFVAGEFPDITITPEIDKRPSVKSGSGRIAMSQSTDESISLTRVINEWKADTENPELAQRAQTLRAINLNPALVKVGLLIENKEDGPHYAPSDEGMSRGITLSEPEKEGYSVFPLYNKEARAYIKELLLSGVFDDVLNEATRQTYQNVTSINKDRITERREKFKHNWTDQDRANFSSTPGIGKGKSISTVLKYWANAEDDELRAKAQEVTPMEMVKRLKDAGLLQWGKGEFLSLVPTEEGKKIGISLAGPNAKGECWPVYDGNAREYIKRFL